ncbi:MAG: ferritin-like domain-containing protein [Solirubrobacterales bacterium]|nr:ferritin-like domain-containing protein [Solirubrobacterales bacterium]
MDIDSFLRDPLSRRRFFRMSGVSMVGGSAVFLAACGDDEPKGSAAGGGADDPSGAEADVEILNSALDLELMAVAAYKGGAALLKGDVLEVGKTFLEQEQEHADALASAITDMGGTPNKVKSSYDFPELRSQEDVLKFAVELENTAVAAYIDALPKLSSGELRGTAAAIVTNEAEHIAVLLGALDRPQVPDAFVTGMAA